MVQGAKTGLSCCLVTRHPGAIHLGHTGEMVRSGFTQSEQNILLYCVELPSARRM